jgi:serine/threonine-protein kinase RsbW
VEIDFVLCLPREGASVPVVRHICGDALRTLGVEDDCIGDLELAVTEACTNVLDHAAGTDAEYGVTFSVEDEKAVIRVTDEGIGFDHGTPRPASLPSDESGRGILLMTSLVDDLRFVSKPHEGTMVHLEKTLGLRDDSVLKMMAGPTAQA